MNEQDTAAADAILLLEAEEKVKMRIMQVVSDVVWGYPESTMAGEYASNVYDKQHQLRSLIRQEIRSALDVARITTPF